MSQPQPLLPHLLKRKASHPSRPRKRTYRTMRRCSPTPHRRQLRGIRGHPRTCPRWSHPRHRRHYPGLQRRLSNSQHLHRPGLLNRCRNPLLKQNRLLLNHPHLNQPLSRNRQLHRSLRHHRLLQLQRHRQLHPVATSPRDMVTTRSPGNPPILPSITVSTARPGALPADGTITGARSQNMPVAGGLST